METTSSGLMTTALEFELKRLRSEISVLSCGMFFLPLVVMGFYLNYEESLFGFITIAIVLLVIITPPFIHRVITLVLLMKGLDIDTPVKGLHPGDRLGSALAEADALNDVNT